MPIILLIAALLGLTWAGAYHDVIFRSVFAPKYEQSGEPAVVYEENRITVSPFELPR